MVWTFGIHPVETLLSTAPDSVHEVWVVQSRKPGAARVRIIDQARDAGVRFRLVNDQQLRGAVGDVFHQGVAARVSEFTYADAETMTGPEGPGLIVVLDEVQDPHNLGAVIRSAAALGARGVVIPRHRAVGVTPTVIKVSAGAAATLPVAQVVNLRQFLESTRERGWWSYAAVVGEGDPIWSVDWGERVILVLGSEGTGVRSGVREACDGVVTLPMSGVESLNVSVAAGVFMYEYARARAVAASAGAG
jgi:23S rRNA (guanosine2251-2'-O)-methyltransferase